MLSDRIMPDIWMLTMSKVVLCFAFKHQASRFSPEDERTLIAG